MKKLKKKMSSLYSGLKKWIFAPGRSILLVIAIIIAVIIIAAVAIGVTLGCLGGIVVAVASLPALLLMFAFNLAIPAFGGPTLTFKMSIGFVLLTVILIGFLSAVRRRK